MFVGLHGERVMQSRRMLPASRARRAIALALSGLLLASAAPGARASADFHLMVGLRSVIASFIADDGYACPDVKRMTQVRFDEDGNAVLKVICGPLGSRAEWGHKPLRVTAYLEGDFSTGPWREADAQPAHPSTASSSAVAYITQE
jgi:hypothetical protein